MRELRLKVIEAETPVERIRVLALAAEEGEALPGFAAGAHIRVLLPDGGDRTYSLINTDPTAGATAAPRAYRLGVRLEENSKGGSAYMHGLKPGDVIRVAELKNDFGLVGSPEPAVLIAGGIGVTPIISMAAEFRAQERAFAFHYSGRSRPLMAFIDEINALCGDALTVHCDDEPACCLDLKALVGALSTGQQIYVCGPRGMIEAVREIAYARGFARDHVHFELFETHEAKSGDQSFEVELSSTGQVFTIPPDKSIIDVLEAEGVDLVYDCQRGDCGICQTAVLDGMPDHRDVILTDDERAANDVMQICVSRAKSARLVLDL